MGPYKPLRNWVDDHPLLYGNNGSLDPSTYIYIYIYLAVDMYLNTHFLEVQSLSSYGKKNKKHPKLCFFWGGRNYRNTPKSPRGHHFFHRLADIEFHHVVSFNHHLGNMFVIFSKHLN